MVLSQESGCYGVDIPKEALELGSVVFEWPFVEDEVEGGYSLSSIRLFNKAVFLLSL